MTSPSAQKLLDCFSESHLLTVHTLAAGLVDVTMGITDVSMDYLTQVESLAGALSEFALNPLGHGTPQAVAYSLGASTAICNDLYLHVVVTVFHCQHVMIAVAFAYKWLKEFIVPKLEKFAVDPVTYPGVLISATCNVLMTVLNFVSRAKTTHQYIGAHFVTHLRLWPNTLTKLPADVNMDVDMRHADILKHMMSNTDYLLPMCRSVHGYYPMYQPGGPLHPASSAHAPGLVKPLKLPQFVIDNCYATVMYELMHSVTTSKTLNFPMCLQPAQQVYYGMNDLQDQRWHDLNAVLTADEKHHLNWGPILLESGKHSGLSQHEKLGTQALH
ncbi:hypothetical protein B0H13DRAFT_2376327 [Mycena leptocephala]|nr:hypothetical protein B0H13DRAFT_2376327 [Mycena leptocephala]